MAEVKQGTVSQILDDGRAVIQPAGTGDVVTPPLYCENVTIDIGDTAAFVLFEDGSGAVLARLGG